MSCKISILNRHILIGNSFSYGKFQIIICNNYTRGVIKDVTINQLTVEAILIIIYKGGSKGRVHTARLGMSGHEEQTLHGTECRKRNCDGAIAS